jgi:hypothetical protein
MSEKTLTEDDVREEHNQSARPGPHWAYLFGVLGVGLLLMLGLIGLFGTLNG